MELKEFASLIASGSTNTAKNTLSYLIGNGLNNNSWGKALAELYKSFPEDLRTSTDSKKEFFPIILKYFTTYQLSSENIEIYKEYEHLFSAKHKDDLKKYNPQWNWSSEPEVVFKNALAFTNALPNGYKEKKFDFIKQYENQFSVFSIKSRDKIIKHFNTQRVWDSLMKEDYLKFIDFCEKYKFDRLEILKENIVSYTDLYNQSIFENEGFNFYLEDLTKIGKENLNIIKNFYPNSQYDSLKRNGDCTVMSVVLNCIGNKQYKNAMKWMIVFDEEINNYSKLFDVENLHTSFNFKKLLTNQIKYLKESSSTYNMSHGILENILKNENWFKFMDSYELFENLSDKLQPKPKTKPTKI